MWMEKLICTLTLLLIRLISVSKRHSWMKLKTRARLRDVAPLGWPRSVYKREVECRFVCQNCLMALKVKVNTSYFQYQLREFKNAYFVHILWFYHKPIKSYCVDKLKFLEFWVKMDIMTLKVNVNDLHFQYQPRVSQDACLVQIWWF